MDFSADQPYVDIPLNIYFSTKNPVPIQRIANSLLALDQLSKRFPGLITELTGIDFGKNYELRVSKVETGSLTQELVCRFILDNPEKKAAIEKYFKEHPKMTKLIFGSLISMLLITGSLTALSVFQGSDSTNIENSYNTTVNITADYVGLTPEEVKGATERAVKRNTKKAVQHSLTITSPVLDDPDSTMTFGRGEIDVSLPREAIDEVDFEVDLTATEQTIPYDNATLQIVSLNRESASSGWTGRVANIGDRVMKIELSDDIDPKVLSYSDEYTVDGEVTFRNDINEGVLVPKSILVTNVRGAN